MSSLANQPAADARPDQMAAARIEQLYSSHAALVRSVCCSLLRDRVEAEDAVQQTFLSAQRALLSGSEPRDAAAWLVTIARHESFGRVRARMREPLPIDTEAEATGPDAHAVAVHRHEFGELRNALEQLPAQQREALLLREVRGLSYEEVASTLSVTTTAVESLLFRARRNLQLRLREKFAAFSPSGLARELAARLGGGFAAPAAAKALAVGVGAAVVTGGAVVSPKLIGHGHAAQTRPTARARAVQQDRHGHVPFDVPSRSGAPMAIDGPSRHEADSSGGEVASRSGGSDGQESPSTAGSDGGGDISTTSDSKTSGSTDGAGTSSGDTQTTGSGNDGTSTDSSSQTTETTTTSSSSDGSGGTTTTSGPGGD